MEYKFKSSILLAIFKRKGGEGIFTKVINNITKYPCDSELEEGEEGIVYFYKDDDNWFLLTNQRIINNRNNTYYSIFLSDLSSVTLDLQRGYRDGVKEKQNFTLLSLEDNQKKKYLFEVEQGTPYFGIYQILSYIVSVNNEKDS